MLVLFLFLFTTKYDQRRTSYFQAFLFGQKILSTLKQIKIKKKIENLKYL